VTDHELNEALDAVINADHSADFVRRVQSNLAIQPSLWHVAWRPALAAAVAAVAVVFVVLPSRDLLVSPIIPVPEPPRAMTRIDKTQLAPPTIAVTPAPSGSAGRAGVRPGTQRQPSLTVSSVGTPAEPEILVAPGEMVAIAQLIATAQSGFVVPDLKMSSSALQVERMTLARLAVPAVSVQPLPRLALLTEGDRQ
jgi:hypothetical protein